MGGVSSLILLVVDNLKSVVTYWFLRVSFKESLQSGVIQHQDFTFILYIFNTLFLLNWVRGSQ